MARAGPPEASDHLQGFAEAGGSVGGGEAGEFSADEDEVVAAGEHQFELLHLDGGDFSRGGGEAQFGEGEEVLDGFGRAAEAVAPVLAEFVEGYLRDDAVELAVTAM